MGTTLLNEAFSSIPENEHFLSHFFGGNAELPQNGALCVWTVSKKGRFPNGGRTSSRIRDEGPPRPQWFFFITKPPPSWQGLFFSDN